MAFGSLLAGEESHPNEIVRIGGRLTGHQVLVPMLTAEQGAITDQLHLGGAIALATGGQLDVIDPAGGDDALRTAVSSDGEVAVEDSMTWARERMTGERPRGVLSGRRAARRLRDRIYAEGYDTLVLPSATAGGRFTRRRVERLADRAGCDVLSVNGNSEFREFASLLLPIANGPHSGLATDVARAIAEESGAYVDVLHVIPPDADEHARSAAEQRAQAAADRIALPDTTSTWILEEDDPAATIVEQSAYYGLTVIGAPTVGRLHQFVYGSTSRSIRNDADSVVIAARSHSER